MQRSCILLPFQIVSVFLPASVARIEVVFQSFEECYQRKPEATQESFIFLTVQLQLCSVYKCFIKKLGEQENVAFFEVALQKWRNNRFQAINFTIAKRSIVHFMKTKTLQSISMESRRNSFIDHV